jgi:membrane protein YqaA with SNARE-associated domain
MIEWLAEYGFIGLFVGAMLAATLLPLSSDVLMVALLTTGAEPVAVVASATAGNFAGGMLSYGLGRLGKWRWLERWFGVTEAKMERQRGRIERWGALVAFFTWLPLIGDVMAVGLGFYRIPVVRCAVFMLLGKAARYVLWAVLYFCLYPA